MIVFVKHNRDKENELCKKTNLLGIETIFKISGTLILYL